MKPNVVLIITDDMPAGQLDYMPQTMSRLVGQGVRFEKMYVASPVCGPNRVSLLGGQYVHTHGITTNDDTARLFKSRQHLAMWLQDHGYATAMFGKWLNGMTFDQIQPWPYQAEGFNDWRVAIDPGAYYGEFKLIENGVVIKYDTTAYSTTVLGSFVRQFISATPVEQPFFIIFAPKAPHAPFDAETQADKDFSKTVPQPNSPAFNEADVSDKPSWVQALPLLTDAEQKTAQKAWRNQVATLQSVDRQIELLLDALELAGRLVNTDIYFTSDNGHVGGEHRLDKGKGCVYEESIKVPLVVRMTGVTPRVDSTHLVSTIDITATILARAGKAITGLKGLDLTQLLQNEAAPWREDLLIEYLSEVGKRPPFHAVHAGRDVYVEYLNGEKEYYNLETDLYQIGNAVLEAANAQRISALSARLAELRTG